MARWPRALSSSRSVGCGVFANSYATVGALEKVLPVDLHIKGCPPRPIELLKGLIALMDKATEKAPQAQER